MKCFFHPELDAVATCQKCGKSLCKECASKYTPCLCDECYNKLRNEEKQNLIDAKKPFIRTIIIGIVFMAVAFFIEVVSGTLSDSPWLPIYLFFIPFGWEYANLLGLTWFFELNSSGCILMLFVYFFRAVLSIIIGIPCFIYALIKLRKLSKAAASIEIENLSNTKDKE